MTRRLTAVFAHPDDETYSLAGTLLLEGDRVRYTVIVASSGEAGEIVSDVAREDLARVREDEQHAALAAAGHGDADVHFLRQPDGGLDAIDRDGLVEAIAEILGRARPQVVVTFGPEGVTLHTDHIAVGQATTEAFHRLQSAEREDAFQRLLYVALPQSDLERYNEERRARGEEFDPGAPFEPRAVPDHTITVWVDVSAVAEGKRRALKAHASQPGTDIAEGSAEAGFLSHECFVQAWPPVADPSGPVMGSVFEGLAES